MGDRATARDWAGLAVLALPCLVVSMDATLLHLALPAVTADLRPSGGPLLWSVDAYVFLGAGALLPMGMAGDRVGRRRLLLAGAAAFVAASVLASLAATAAQLIAARGLLGLAGATLMPSTLALIRTMFRDAAQRRQAIGVWTASFALGGLLGPVAGGLVLTVRPWPAVFLLAVPPMLLLLALGPVLLPESRDPAAGRVDLVTAVTALAAVLAVVVGLTTLAAGDAGPGAAAAVAAGLGLAVLLARRQRRQADPVLDPALFGRASFAAPLGVNALAFFVLYGTQYLTAQYLQLVLGLSPLAAGLWGIPGTLSYVLGSAVGPLVTRRVPPVAVVAAGLLVSAAGFGLLTRVEGSGLAVVVAGTVVFGFGIAPVYALTTELVLAAAPDARAGTVSATQETGAELGGALGIALLGCLSLVVYRATVPAGTPDTLAGALAADPGTAEAARAAFTSAYVVAEAAGATLLVAAAAAFALLLRRPTRRPAPSRPAA